MIFLLVPIMPRVVFTDDLEKKLIEIWAEYQRNKTGKLMKRSPKEKEIASTMNEHARELSGEQDPFTATMVHYKIDNLKSKARDQYKKFQFVIVTGKTKELHAVVASDLALW